MARFESPSVTLAPRGPTIEGDDTECSVVSLRGEYDVASKSFLRATLTCATRFDDGNVAVDLSAVTFMDASTVGVIVGIRNRLRLQSRSLELIAPSRAARLLLDACGLTYVNHPTPLATVHPVGVARALGSWVDVPPAPSTRESPTEPAAGTPEAARVG